MCRWLAYVGAPVTVGEVMFGAEHSIVKQSLTSFEGAETTNGDGFGVGWYSDEAVTPSRYRSIEPAWNDVNLREITETLKSRVVLAHVRASSGAPVQLTNCHPFRHGRLLFVHNGVIDGFARLRRQLLLDLPEERFLAIEGSTDSEALFQLALVYGLEQDPVRALELAVGHVEALAQDIGIEPAVQLSAAVTDGDSVWAVRYATSDEPRTLYHSTEVSTLQEMYPKVKRFGKLEAGAHALVSEPMTTLPGVWQPVPAGSAVILRRGEEQFADFTPEHSGRTLAAAYAA